MLSCFSHVRFFETLRTVARQAPLPMGFSRQEYWSILLDTTSIGAMPSSRGSSQPRNWTQVSYVSCPGIQVLYHQRLLGSPFVLLLATKGTETSSTVLWCIFLKNKSTASLLFPKKSQYLVFLSSSLKKKFWKGDTSFFQTGESFQCLNKGFRGIISLILGIIKRLYNMHRKDK